MPTAKQIKARKLFAMRAKRGDFRKKIAKKKRIAKSQKSDLKPKDYGTSKDPHQIPQGMLDELYQSKIRGFPFFSYTGIREFVMMGNDSLMLKKIPPNPTGITAIQINYDKGADGFTMVYFVGNKRVANPEVLFVGDLAENIVQKMGIT